jgi:hypothetical protein
MSVLGACWRRPILGENQGSFEGIKAEIKNIRQHARKWGARQETEEKQHRK